MDIKCPHCGSYNNIREVVTRCLECNQNLFNQKTNNMNNVFKKGDRLYHIHHGWGTVEEVTTHGNITVDFDKDFRFQSSKTGTFMQLLSFTEYRLEGFTQQRPFEPEIGKFYWFWDEEMKEKKSVIYGKLGGICLKEKYPYYCIGAAGYTFISDKNPLE